MFLKINVSKLTSVFLATLMLSLIAVSAHAAVLQSAFGDDYQAVPAVGVTQSQVVYYRLGTPGQKAEPSFVYIDKEFHTGLLPGGYTVFCLAPGRHGLSAVVDDAPRYGGKRVQPGVRLVPGKTQFIRVNEAGSLEPQLVARETAEQELAGARRQVHVLSRAAVQSCEYVAQPEVQSYTLSGDVLFGFGKSAYGDIREEGRKAFSELLHKLGNDNLQVNQIEVVGHTDPIGSIPYNDALGLRRAQTVRQLLIDSGVTPQHINARSEGSRQLVTHGCSGDRAAQIACHAPDRRVVVEVTASGEK